MKNHSHATDNIISEPTLTIALCGNPNSGKTTLFNQLTGSNQKVGNWPGVTVEYKAGMYRSDKSVSIIDTPGIYSLTPFTVDEQIAHNYLLNNKPDLVINIVDSTNLERNLFLTTQLLDLDVPLVVALNMSDEAEAKGMSIDSSILQQTLGCDFFNISAAKGTGIIELMNYCIAKRYPVKKPLRFDSNVEHALSNIATELDNTDNKRWISLKLLETDNKISKLVSDNTLSVSQAQSKSLTDKLDHSVQNELATQRYAQLSRLACNATTRITPQPNSKQARANIITNAIDKIVLNKWLAFPIFALIMTVVFYVSIGGLGGWLCDLINESLTPWLQAVVTGWLAPANQLWLTSLIVDGMMAGVLGVVSFVPQIMLLFGFISILEASGYMSRIAFITDKLLNKIGLGGKSFVSMILGCGCSVPAIMATRTIKNINERNTTITLTPMMPCSAKMAIIAFFTSKVLGGNALIAVSFYFISIASIILVGLALKIFAKRKADASDTFIMELPEYRMPTVGAVTRQMWERGKSFLIKAGTIILVSSLALWLLQNFSWSFAAVDAENSMLSDLGRLIAPIFVPLGFGEWQFAVASLSGIVAKETVVSTIEILFAGADITTIVGPIGAYSFVVYNLLTVPCIAAVSASFSEQGNWKKGVKSIVIQLTSAYVVSLVIYQLATLAQKYTTTFIVALSCIVVAFALYFSIKYLVTHKGCNYECHHCPNNDSCPKDKNK